MLLFAIVVVLALAAYSIACLAGLLLIAPLMAAPRLTPRITAALGAVAIGLAVVLLCLGERIAVDNLTRVLVVTTGTVWAVLTACALARQRADLGRMTRLAEQAQQAVLHPLPSRVGDTCLAFHSRSATSHAMIGGDLYDAVLTTRGLRLIIGDVKGHGVDAACLASAVLAAFRLTAATEPDLARLARTIDARIAPQLGLEDFVTVLLADFLPGEVHLVNCGHPPPLRAGRRLTIVESPHPSPPLGLSPAPQTHRIRLDSTERLLLYTDGLTEARDRDGEMLPLDASLRNALAAATLDSALDGVLDLLQRHAAGTAVHDDLTLILIQSAAAQGAPVRPRPPTKT